MSLRKIFTGFIIFSVLSINPVYAAQIDGKKLDNVSDVISTAKESFEMEKDSLFIIRSDGQNSLVPEIMTFNTDGTVDSETSGTAISVPGLNRSTQGLKPSATTLLSKDTNEHIIITTNGDGTTNSSAVNAIRSTVENTAPVLANLGLANTANYFAMDTAGGLVAANDSEHEYFAVSYSTLAAFPKSNRSNSSASENSVKNAQNILKIYEVDRKTRTINTTAALDIPLGNGATPRIATGDFDGDGIADEVAVFRRTNFWGAALEIYKITRTNGALSSSKFYSLDNWGATKTDSEGYEDYIECITAFDESAVVAGDFDGDGKSELVVTYINAYNYVPKNQDLNYTMYIVLRYFKWDSSTKKMTMYNYRQDQSKFNSGSPGNDLAIKAAAVDFDGDGKDELFVAYLNSNNGNKTRFFITQCGSSLTNVSTIYTDTSAPSDIPTTDFMWSDASIAGGAFRGQTGKTHFKQEVMLSLGKLGGNDNFYGKQHLFMMYPEYDSSGKITSLTRKEVKTWNNSGMLGITARDFAAESLSLGKPEHLKVTNRVDYAAILQVPPYHVDYIPLPWEQGSTAKIQNISYSDSAATKYTNSSTSAQSKELQYKMSSAVEKTVKKEIGGALKNKIISFNLTAKFSTKDKVEKVTQESSKNADSVKVQSTSSTTPQDSLTMYKSNMHIWRYPVAKPVPSWFLKGGVMGSGENTSEDTPADEVYLTFTMNEEVQPSTATSFGDENYHPIHEEGNLFSYPTNLVTKPGYSSGRVMLAPASNKNRAANTTMTMTFTTSDSSGKSFSETANHDETENINVTTKFMSKILNANASLEREQTKSTSVGNTSSFTKSYSNEESISVNIPGGISQYADYTIQGQAYIDAAGTTIMGFAVTSFGRDGTDAAPMLWRSSVYTQKPDPSLVLPRKFMYNNKTWVANVDEYTAKTIRGIRFYDIDASEYVSKALLTSGTKYRISVPVYNASFVDAGNVKVNLYYQKRSDSLRDTSKRKLIASTSVNLGGWKEFENGKGDANKATIVYDWDTTGLAKDNYYLIVVLDPDNKINEIHESWSATVPGGNNEGISGFGVWTAADAKAASERTQARIQARAAAAADSDDDDDEDYTLGVPIASSMRLRINGMTVNSFDKYLRGLDNKDPFIAECSLYYDSDDLGSEISDVRFELWNVEVDAEGEDVDDWDFIQTLIMSKNIPLLIRGSEYKFNVIVQPELLISDLPQALFPILGSDTDDEVADYVLIPPDDTNNNSGNNPDNPNDDNSGDSDSSKLGGSSGGCNSGISIIGLCAAFLAFALKRINH